MGILGLGLFVLCCEISGKKVILKLMKKCLTFAMVLIWVVVLASPFSVSAKTKAGTKPGSFFYFFDKAFEKGGFVFHLQSRKESQESFGERRGTIGRSGRVGGRKQAGSCGGGDGKLSRKYFLG